MIAGKPLLSVVIPTRHRNDLLARCLRCLAPGRQSLPFDCYELIVADAGQETTVEKLLADQFPWARRVAAPGAWPAANRNRGAAEAVGEWLVFLDDDIYMADTYLAEIAKEVSRGGAELIEGRIECPDPLPYPFDMSPVNESGGLYWSANLIVHRECFVRLGGFDEDFERGEDIEFAHRYLKAGVSARFAGAAVVIHPRRRLNLKGFWRHTLNDRWRLLVRLKIGHARSVDTPLIIAIPAFVCTESVNYLRTSYHLLSRFDRTQRRRQILGELWKWVTAPIMFPYLVYWEIRFRRMASTRRNGPRSRPAISE